MMACPFVFFLWLKICQDVTNCVQSTFSATLEKQRRDWQECVGCSAAWCVHAQLLHLLSLELANFLFMGFKDLISNGYSSLHKVLNGRMLWPNNAPFAYTVQLTGFKSKILQLLFYLQKKTENLKSQTVFRVKNICKEKEMEKSWYLWKGFLKDLGERVVGGGRPNSMLITHPCETQEPCFLLSAGCWLNSNSPVIISEVS